MTGSIAGERIYATAHAVERYRQRVEPTATIADLLHHASLAARLSPHEALALNTRSGRRPDCSYRTDGAVLFALGADLGIITVYALTGARLVAARRIVSARLLAASRQVRP